MNQRERVLVAGATGYLGGYLLEILKKRGYRVRALARTRDKAAAVDADETVVGQVTEPSSLRGIADGIDAVVSAIGITRQKDGLTYEDVDYQGNVNLLEESKRAGVRKFIYVSALGADAMPHLKMTAAKERFAAELAASELDYAVMRPNGYFSDMGEFLKMARKGRIYLFGNGDFRMNPVHGRNVAKACVNAIESNAREFNFGGPAVLTHREIASAAFQALKKPVRITCVPSFLAHLAIPALHACTSSKSYGPIEFFLTVLTRDMIGEPFGTESLHTYFEDEARAYGAKQ